MSSPNVRFEEPSHCYVTPRDIDSHRCESDFSHPVTEIPSIAAHIKVGCLPPTQSVEIDDLAYLLNHQIGSPTRVRTENPPFRALFQFNWLVDNLLPRI